jgi:hypothetical protein
MDKTCWVDRLNQAGPVDPADKVRKVHQCARVPKVDMLGKRGKAPEVGKARELPMRIRVTTPND